MTMLPEPLTQHSSEPVVNNRSLAQQRRRQRERQARLMRAAPVDLQYRPELSVRSTFS